MLTELQFCRRRKIPISIGRRKLLEKEGWLSKEKYWKKGLRCRKTSEDEE